MRLMTQGRARAAFSSWTAIIVTGLFVLVTHYVGVGGGCAAGLPRARHVAGAAVPRRRRDRLAATADVPNRADPRPLGGLWSLGSYGPTGLEPVWVLGFAFEGYYDVALALLALTFPAVALGRPAGW